MKEFFENEAYIKILHGCETDLRLLKKEFDFNIVNIFDTAKAHV